MSTDRFLCIQRYLHISNNTQCPARGRHKIQAVIGVLTETFLKYYTPGHCLSVDEQMIGIKCRVSVIQYMPKKPKKFGITFWALCEAATGYCCNFQVYTSKEDGSQEHGLANRVVTDLLKPYPGKWHIVYFDNFSLVQLVSDLLKQQILCCGTIRQKRANLLDGFGKAKMKRGKRKFWSCDNITVLQLFHQGRERMMGWKSLT